MMTLGFWQLERAEFKATLQQNIAERKNLSAVAITDLTESGENRRYRAIKFTGEYDKQRNFLQDNITLNGKVGYYVYTPVKIDGFKSILVNRGFVAQGATREQLPEVNAPDGKIDITGILDFPPSRTLLLAENVQQTTQWPAVMQYIDLVETGQLLNQELYDMVLWLSPKEVAGFEYNLPVLNLNAAKNSGYAFQWFAMSLALFIIYFVVNTKRNSD